ncbi:hypothetical protein B0H14DRAFT_538602 [Mycena olivaceomarginata]|nr:hypothetical protein B0H14DRAFT_538602 [Mycena olivaceomarginata]
MAHPLFWPGKRYFYAIGNTSAVSLARDVPPTKTSVYCFWAAEIRETCCTLSFPNMILQPANLTSHV